MPFHLTASAAINKDDLCLTCTYSTPKHNALGSQRLESIILFPSKSTGYIYKTLVFNGLQRSHLVLHFVNIPSVSEHIPLEVPPFGICNVKSFHRLSLLVIKC